ncbi:hypothetical protein BDW66DRAFT_145541 [Aspergillus desertorum]
MCRPPRRLRELEYASRLGSVLLVAGLCALRAADVGVRLPVTSCNDSRLLPVGCLASGPGPDWPPPSVGELMRSRQASGPIFDTLGL